MNKRKILLFQPAEISQFSSGYFFNIMAMFFGVGSILRLSRYFVAYSCFMILTKWEFPERLRSYHHQRIDFFNLLCAFQTNMKDPLFEFGFDILMSVLFTHKKNNNFKVNISLSLFVVSKNEDATLILTSLMLYTWYFSQSHPTLNPSLLNIH